MTTPTWDVLLADHSFLIPGTSTPRAASGGQRSPDQKASPVHGGPQQKTAAPPGSTPRSDAARQKESLDVPRGDH